MCGHTSSNMSSDEGLKAIGTIVASSWVEEQVEQVNRSQSRTLV